MKEYGLTVKEYDSLRKEQDYKCRICSIPEKEAPYNRLVVDHCHTNGHVRGLLCSQCNTGLGLFKDDTDRLEAAMKYLEETVT